MRKSSVRRAFAAVGVGIAALAAGSPTMAGPVDRWQWLEDTYWYVPAEYLLALASSPSLKSPIPVSDQTVYHITHYQGGYFWGPTAVTYVPPNGSTATGPSCLQLVGSVTPEGKVT